MLRKAASRTIIGVFGMTQPGIEPQSPKTLMNTLLNKQMAQLSEILIWRYVGSIYIYIYIYIYYANFKNIHVDNTMPVLNKESERAVPSIFTDMKDCILER